MFSIGQHVIHPGQGVCTVVGFRDDTPQPMLLLETKQGHAQTILMYPVAQADRLHAAISQQDAEHLLSHYDELECDTFTERNSSLEETHFKQQLKLGAPETVRVAKTMMHRIRQAEEADKKTQLLLHARTQGGQTPLHRGVRRGPWRHRGGRRSPPSPSRPQLTHPRQKPPQREQAPLWWFSCSSSIHSYRYPRAQGVSYGRAAYRRNHPRPRVRTAQ